MNHSTAKRYAALLLCPLAYGAGILSSQQIQTPAPDEVRIQSSVYWPRPQFTLRVDIKLVEVGVVVRDNKGRAVNGLTRDDFSIEDAGKKREIKAFSVEAPSPTAATSPARPAAATPPGKPAAPMSAPPRFVALLLDDLSIGFPELVRVKAAAKRFISEGLSAGDQMGVFTTSGAPCLGFTSDVPQIVAAIDRFNASPRVPNGGICPRLTPYDAFAIAVNRDQTALAIKAAELSRCKGGPATRAPASIPVSASASDISSTLSQAEVMWAQIQDTSRASLRNMSDLVGYMSSMPGRRMILLASSGFLAQTLEHEQEEIIRYALRRQIVVNALDAKGLYTQDPIESTLGASVQSFIYQNSVGIRQKDMGNEVLANFAASTGGLFFHNNNDLTLGFREVGLLPEVSYVLGIDPGEAMDGKYHKLKVQVKSKNRYSLQSRPGYWAFPNSEQSPLSAARAVDQKILSDDTVDDLPARVMEVRAITEDAEPAIDVVFHIDVSRLHLEKAGEIRTQKLTWIAALLDARGSFIAGKENQIELALKEPTFNRMAVNGLNIMLTLRAPPGPYTLRSAVQDGLDGKMAAMSLHVEIR
jgi:VWFA-related protein